MNPNQPRYANESGQAVGFDEASTVGEAADKSSRWTALKIRQTVATANKYGLFSSCAGEALHHAETTFNSRNPPALSGRSPIPWYPRNQRDQRSNPVAFPATMGDCLEPTPYPDTGFFGRRYHAVSNSKWTVKRPRISRTTRINAWLPCSEAFVGVARTGSWSSSYLRFVLVN